MIDIDEAAVFAEGSNRGEGKSHLTIRCRDDGIYGHSTKTNMLLAILGERPTAVQDSARWLEMWEEGGTTVMKFITFIQRIPNDIGPGTPQRRRCFTMDNLNSHRNIVVQQMIHQAGHRIAFRAPYHPVDGLIEYYFNHVQHDLTLAMYRVQSLPNVQREVRNSLRNTSNFRPYFIFVGFPDN